MRTLNFFALVGIFLASALIAPKADAALLHQSPFQPGANYVVIGAFAIHNNAINFTSHAKELHYNARYELNPNRNLYYVYVLDTDDRERAINEARRLREETEFIDAWVYGGSFDEEGTGEDINPVTEQQIEPVSNESSMLPSIAKSAAPAQSGQTTSKVPPTPDASGEDDKTLGTKFLFKIFRASSLATLEGDVQVIDTDRSRRMATYKGNIPVRVTSPANNTGGISLMCEVFGYRKVQYDLNYNDPQGLGIQQDADGNFVVPFEMVRLQKGDIAVMYNVYFFKDAGVMRPESRYEVSSLLDMLRENPNYRIKLHGHTNGNAPGKIISMNDKENFFSLNDTKEGFGSAKKLSQERAEVIKEYLVNEGIDPGRMEIKAWGGKRPIHDKNSPRAEENVRVEVEILQD